MVLVAEEVQDDNDAYGGLVSASGDRLPVGVNSCCVDDGGGFGTGRSEN